MVFRGNKGEGRKTEPGDCPDAHEYNKQGSPKKWGVADARDSLTHSLPGVGRGQGKPGNKRRLFNGLLLIVPGYLPAALYCPKHPITGGLVLRINRQDMA